MKRNNKTAQNKEKIKKIVLFIFMMLIGAIGGFLWGYMLPSSDTESSMDIIKLAISIGIFILAFFIQIILHEAGHLICGLLSGYEFVSFRVGSLTLVKEDGKFSIKKFSIKGTGGKCLLMPKNDNYKECSYILYNLGGILMNLIVSIIFFILYMVFKGNSYVYIALISMVITGILIFITNGVPMKISGVANDGYNLVSIIKNDLMKYCFYMQLKVNGLLHKGIRIKDMPLEWFLIDKNADFSNPLVCSIKCLEANYYHDKLEFDKAKDCYEFLLNYSPKIIPLYENEIKCELLFYEIIGEKNEEIINDLYTKKLKAYIKATDCYITRKRLNYAYALIIEKDLEKVNRILKEVEKVKRTYPVKSEIESELEIIDFVTNDKRMKC